MSVIRTREADVLRAILDFFAAKHIYALRLNTGSGWMNGRPIQHHSGGAGVADIVAFLPLQGGVHRVLWCECKSDTGRQTLDQRNFEEAVTGLGMHYLIARTVEDVEQWLVQQK